MRLRGMRLCMPLFFALWKRKRKRKRKRKSGQSIDRCLAIYAKLSIASASAFAMPGSVTAWPASSMMRNFELGQAL